MGADFAYYNGSENGQDFLLYRRGFCQRAGRTVSGSFADIQRLPI